MQGTGPERKLSSPTEQFKNYKNVLGCVGNAHHKNSSASKAEGNAKMFCNLTLPMNKDKDQLDRSSEKNQGIEPTDLSLVQELNDGADSGVEARALSSNGSNSDRFTPIQSCGSSLVSYSSEPEIDRGSECDSESSGKTRLRNESDCGDKCWKTKTKYQKIERSRIGSRKGSCDGERTSESCSETSSTHEAITPDQLTRSVEYKLSTSGKLHEGKLYEKGVSSAGRRLDSNRGHGYDKSSTRSHSSARSAISSVKVNSSSRSLSMCRNAKSGDASRVSSKESKRVEDGGRWSMPRGQKSGARIRVSSVADPTRKSMSSSMTSSLTGASVKSPAEVNSNALEKYGTLPRRPKKKSTESHTVARLQASLSRSNSVSRESGVNRAASLRNQQAKERGNYSTGKSLPPYPKTRKSPSKTLIYHEVSVQTLITSQDFSVDHSGIHVANKIDTPVPEKNNKGIQTEGKERLKKMEDDFSKQSEELKKIQKENQKLRTEKMSMMMKISKLLGHPEPKEGESIKNGLDELEQHFQAVGLTVIKQQEELSELRRCKLIAHRDLEKSLAAQKNLLQQQQEIEEEYSELQEFLQAEKTALSESLLDTEEELKRLNSENSKKQLLIEQQQEECKHLVRICEQRRQENLSLEAKLAGLDQRSRDVLVQQGAAVSAAAVALSGLGARLDTLVEQLAISCNITEKEIEDVIYHNEVYNQSEDNSPNETPSKSSERPKRESFLKIILGAIRNAAHSPFSKKNSAKKSVSDHKSESPSFFDAESEPCINFTDTGVEENSSSLSNCTDSGTYAKEESSASYDDSLCKSEMKRSDSLQNLSVAILNRQLVEKNEIRESLDEIIPIEVNSLVDQIVDVDNLFTKLLKVIRIVQAESEQSVEKLQDERAVLTGQIQEQKTHQQKLESNLQKLQKELTDARSQLNARISQLEEVQSLCAENRRVAVVEMQKRFDIIDTALGALNSVPDMVNRCPPLAQLRQELEDCNYEDTSRDDVNANPASNDNGLLQTVKRNGAVLTTAI